MQKKGYTHLTIQAGNGSISDSELNSTVKKSKLLTIEWCRYKPNILADIEASDLVISHAGKSTLLAVFTSEMV